MNRMLNVLIFVLVLMGLAGCVKQQNLRIETKILNLSKFDDSYYTGGLNTQHLMLAEQILSHLSDDIPIQICPENSFNSAQKVGSSESLTSPYQKNYINGSVNALMLNVRADNQLAKDVSLYVLSRLGPAVTEVMPELEYYNQHYTNFSFWIYHAMENIECENWIDPSFDFNKKLMLLPVSQRIQMVFDDMFQNQYLFPYGIHGDFIKKHLLQSDHIDQNILTLVSFLTAKDRNIEDLEDIMFTLEYLDFSDSNFDISPFINMFESWNNDLANKLEFIIFNNQHPYGLKIIESKLNQGAFEYTDSVCFYKEQANQFEPLLLQRAKKLVTLTEKEAMITALGCIGTEDSIPWLIEQLSDPNWELQIHSIKALKSVNIDHQNVKKALQELDKSTWSKVIKDFINDRNPYITPECLADEYYGCPIYEGPLAIDLSRLPINHGMTVCKNDAWFSYDEVNWFKVNWQGSDNTNVPDGFPENLLSDRFEHTLLEIGGGWLFGSDHGHYSGSLYFWNETEKSGYYLGLGAEAFKILKHNDMVLGLGYSYETSVSGQIFNLSVNEEGFWVADHKLTLPSAPYLYGYDPDGELLIADDLNQYSFRNNKITPLNCKIE